MLSVFNLVTIFVSNQLGFVNFNILAVIHSTVPVYLKEAYSGFPLNFNYFLYLLE